MIVRIALCLIFFTAIQINGHLDCSLDISFSVFILHNIPISPLYFPIFTPYAKRQSSLRCTHALSFLSGSKQKDVPFGYLPDRNALRDQIHIKLITYFYFTNPKSLLPSILTLSSYSFTAMAASSSHTVFTCVSPTNEITCLSFALSPDNLLNSGKNSFSR